ncbi:unnamed protein product, partial [Strongylus vulgaris]
WCPGTKTCEESTTTCNTRINLELNCPRLPNPAYAYNETFARYYITPIVAGVHALSPAICLKNQIPHASYYQDIHTQCGDDQPNVRCHAYTAWDPVEKAVIISFEGTSSGVQLADEFESFLKQAFHMTYDSTDFRHKVQFFDNGYLFKYFNDAFMDLWNAGLEQQVRTLKYQYPDYKAYVTGHSLGASMASVCAAYLVKWNMWAPENVRLVTFGQPRTGDYDFATWHDATFPYSYRIVHQNDPVPHIPPRLGPDRVFHHRFEVWYDNDMAVGQPYTICQEADGDYCSNVIKDDAVLQHLWYFDKFLHEWGAAGCP